MSSNATISDLADERRKLADELNRQANHARWYKGKYGKLDVLFLVFTILLGAAATTVSTTSAVAQDAIADWLGEADSGKKKVKLVMDILVALCAGGSTIFVGLHQVLKISDNLSRGTKCYNELKLLKIALDGAIADVEGIRNQYKQIAANYPEIIV